MAEFIHLHNHTHFSLLDGACTVGALVKAAVKNEMQAVALTDHGSMFGIVEFYKKAKSNGIKPIIGNEMYMMTKGSRGDRSVSDSHPEGKRHGYNHIVLLAKNETGYRNLIKLTTRSHTEGFYYKPRIDFELLEQYHEGLVALTACRGGVVASYLVAGDYDSAKGIASRLKDMFGEDVYLEIQNHGLEDEVIVREGMKRLSEELGMKLIATNDCHYIEQKHAIAHNVFLHIADVRMAEDVSKLRYGTDQVFFKSEKQMQEAFRDYPEALKATLEVAEKCIFDLELGTIHMPDFPIPENEGSDLNVYLKHLADDGLKRHYPTPTDDLKARLTYELDLITKMGYAGYFLIVQDFINTAKSMGIRVGPGRGSAAGSLVAYSLGITDVDPIRYDLLFERFLNPERVSMPDIDVDFQDDRRGEVIDYVRQKYGIDSVSQIVTFSTLSARAVLKDVGRVLGVPLGTIEKITKTIPVKMGKVQPLKFALGIEKDPENKWSDVKELQWVRESDDPKIKQLVEYSLILEGLVRGAGMHAAGVVIATSDTSDFVPLYKTPSTELMTMYNMNDLEEAGLLKMDFLGLITLSVIDRALTLIQKTRGVLLDMDAISLEDPATYEMIGEGHTIGVFQFESPQMRDYLRKLKPKTIDDLAAMNALYRPGPMQFIDDFIDRKYGRKSIEYLHEKMEPILKPTYGIIVFQEQVIQLASAIAGFTLAQADIMRRAMGKKKADVMTQQRKAFVLGAKERGLTGKVAEEIFDMIDKFANYGFNKSHSVAYSLLAYQTAYLKANYTPEFMAAMMSSEMGKTEKVAVLIDECRKLGIAVLPPDINESEVDFTVSQHGIRFGLAAVKNVGTGAVEEIVKARKESGGYKTIFEFAERVNTRAVNKKTMESLVLAGAMDSIEGGRAQLHACIENAIAYGQQHQQHLDQGQTGLFDDVPEKHAGTARPKMPKMDDWSELEKLANEKSVLGFYVSGHPLEGWRSEAAALSSVQLGEFDPEIDGQIIHVCGVIDSVRTKIDRNGKTMAFVIIEDFTGKAETIMYSRVYDQFAPLLVHESPVLITGKAEISGDSLKVRVDEVRTLEAAVIEFAKGVVVTLSTNTATKKQIHDGIAVMDELRSSGNCPCFFYISDEAGNSWNLLARQHKVRPTKEVLQRLRGIFGNSSVRITLEEG